MVCWGWVFVEFHAKCMIASRWRRCRLQDCIGATAFRNAVSENGVCYVGFSASWKVRQSAALNVAGSVFLDGPSKLVNWNVKIHYGLSTGVSMFEAWCNVTTCSKAASVPWIIRRLLIVESWVQSQFIPCAICAVHLGIGRGFPPSTPVCPCLHHFMDNA